MSCETLGVNSRQEVQCLSQFMSWEQIYYVRVMVVGFLSSLAFDKDLFCILLSAGTLPNFAVNATNNFRTSYKKAHD